MDDLLIKSRLQMPVTTGIPTTSAQSTRQQTGQTQTPSFREILEKTARREEISFSKHAAGRIAQREIELSETSLERLNEGMQIARGKGMQDALILMDGSAFIVSAKNNTVITAISSRELIGKAITNIDGTVIL